MNSRQRGTLAAIFETPTRADIDWDDVVSLLSGLGAEVSEEEGRA